MHNSQQQRKRFKTLQDWYNFINSTELTCQTLLEIRTQCYREIEEHRSCPLLIYATKFLDPLPSGSGASNFIDLSDIDGFTDLVNSVTSENQSKKVDILLHSPGGMPDATERIVYILRNKFEEINFLIPHSAYSAATMLSLSGDTIVLHPSATLGPIDPQINGIPARLIKKGFEKAKENIAKEGAQSLPAYLPLIEKYTLDLLELCEDSEKLSKELVTHWLKNYMFKDQKNASKKIKRAVNYFSNYNKHLLHSRPLSMDKLKKFGLKIHLADNTLQELLWEAYIMLEGFFKLTPFVKLYENAHGLSWGKHLQKFT